MTRHGDSVDKEMTSVMKRVDKSLAAGVKAVLPVTAGVDIPHHPTIIEDDHDAPVAEKMAFAGPLGIDPTNIKISGEITQEDIETLKKKAYIATLRDFDNWLLNSYLGGVEDATKKAWLLDIYPEWFDRQKETIDRLNDVKMKYEVMRIEGPTTLEDIYFMYIYERDLKSYVGSVADMASRGILGGISRKDFSNKYQLADDEQESRFISLSFERGLFNTRKRWNQMFEQWMTAFNRGMTDQDLIDAAARLPAHRPTRDEFMGLQNNKVAALTNPYTAASFNADPTNSAARSKQLYTLHRQSTAEHRVAGPPITNYGGKPPITNPTGFSAMSWR